MLAAVLCWSLYTVLLRLRPGIHPLSFLAATFAIGVVTMLPLAVLEYRSGARLIVTPMSLAAIFYVAVLPSVVAYLLYNRAVELIGAAKAGQFINLMPLFGAVLAVALLGETLEGYHWAGGALILVGIMLFMRAALPEE